MFSKEKYSHEITVKSIFHLLLRNSWVPNVMWQWSTTNWRFQKWLNNTLGNNIIECKKLAKIVSHVAVTFRHSCLTVFAWRRVVLRFFDPKQLLRVSRILWCYYPKCYSIIFENASLWCFIVTQHFANFSMHKYSNSLIKGIKKHSLSILLKILLSSPFDLQNNDKLFCDLWIG